MFIGLLVLFFATAFAACLVATLAAAQSWRAYGLLSLLGGGWMAWLYLEAPATASPGSPSQQFVMGFVAAGFFVGMAFAPVFAAIIRALAKPNPDTAHLPGGTG